MPELAFRTAAAADLAALKTLVEGAYRGDSARRGWTHEADLLDDERIGGDDLAALLADPQTTVLLATDTGLAGCVALSRREEVRAYLGMFCIDPARQAAGLGKRLLAAAEAHLLAQGITAIEMTVIEQRGELIAWYERRGYRLTGERRPFPVLRDPPLEFVVLEKRLASA